MENNKIFSEIQRGFKKYRSTADHLIRMDTLIRKGFANEEKVISIFIDMEKAYDKTWRYQIWYNERSSRSWIKRKNANVH